MHLASAQQAGIDRESVHFFASPWPAERSVVMSIVAPRASKKNGRRSPFAAAQKPKSLRLSWKFSAHIHRRII